MATDNWYRNKTWSNEIESEFEERFKRSRGAFNKAQYLRIQACYLLETTDKKTQLVGLGLMQRLLNEFSEEKYSIISAQEQLGDYYLKLNEFYKAEEYFRIVKDYYQDEGSRSGTTGIADLKLVETILWSNQEKKFEEAYVLYKNHPVGELLFNSDIFYYTELGALLCDVMNKKEEAKDYAKTAIEISKIEESQFSRHKTVGLVKATGKQIERLKHILNKV